MNCKFCGVEDLKENMHKDKHTKEYYHKECRPVKKKERRKA